MGIRPEHVANAIIFLSLVVAGAALACLLAYFIVVYRFLEVL